MGVSLDSNLLTEHGVQKRVVKVSAKEVYNMSRYTMKERLLRYETDTEVRHSMLHVKYHFPEQRMRTYVTEDGYTLTATDDTEVLTVKGWKRFGEVEVGDVLMTNGTDDPSYKDEETLRRLYMEEHMTQGQIAELLGVSPRTIRYYCHAYNLDKGIGPKLMGRDNPRWKGEDVSKRGGYDRTHEKFDKMKTGVCSRCGRTLPTQWHHDDRNPINTSDDNLIELCDLCHAAEHHGMVIKWTRPAKVVTIRYGGVEDTVGFALDEGENVVVEGFIVRFDPLKADKTVVMEAP